MRRHKKKNTDAVTILAEQLVEANRQIIKFAQNAQNAAILAANDQRDRVQWELEVEKRSAMPTPEPRRHNGGRVASRQVDPLDDETPDDGESGMLVDLGRGYGSENNGV